MAKIPGQKPRNDDISKQTRDQIMKEIEKAQAADHCTETRKNDRRR
jgi:hypothetical protein